MNDLVVNKSYAVTVAGQRYPAQQSQQPADFFVDVGKRIFSAHAIKKMQKTEMYKAFGVRLEEAQKAFKQVKKFLFTIWRSNSSGNQQVKQEKLLPIQKKIESLTFSPPPALTAELAIRPQEDVHEALNIAVMKSISALVNFTTVALDGMVDAEQVGLIEWFDAETARYHYFLDSYDVQDTILARRHTQTGQKHHEEVDRQTTTTATHQRHQHDIVDAKQWKLEEKVYVPFRAERLIHAIPDMFRPFFRVVTGNQIFEHVVQRTETTLKRSTENRDWEDPPPPPEPVFPPQSVFRYDPAVIFGHYVVCGWGENEEKLSKGWEKDSANEMVQKKVSVTNDTRIVLMSRRSHIDW